MMATSAPSTTPAIAPFERPELGSLADDGDVGDDVGDVEGDVEGEVAESWIRSAA